MLVEGLALGDVRLNGDLLQALGMAQPHLFHLAVEDGQFVLAVLVVLPEPEQVGKGAGDESQKAAK